MCDLKTKRIQNGELTPPDVQGQFSFIRRKHLYKQSANFELIQMWQYQLLYIFFSEVDWIVWIVLKTRENVALIPTLGWWQYGDVISTRGGPWILLPLYLWVCLKIAQNWMISHHISLRNGENWGYTGPKSSQILPNPSILRLNPELWSCCSPCLMKMHRTSTFSIRILIKYSP